jgi:hypothetical protein
MGCRCLSNRWRRCDIDDIAFHATWFTQLAAATAVTRGRDFFAEVSCVPNAFLVIPIVDAFGLALVSSVG